MNKKTIIITAVAVVLALAGVFGALRLGQNNAGETQTDSSSGKKVEEATVAVTSQTEEETEAEPGEDVDVEPESEEDIDDDFDGDIDEGYKCQEDKKEKKLSFETKKYRKRDDIDAEADDKKEIARKRFLRALDDADSDRDYRMSKGITRRNESKISKKISEAKKCEGDECKDDECKGEKKIDEAPNYELLPRYDARKSFYGKARVDTGDDNTKNRLYSYDTLVAEIKDGKPVVYGTYSQTTLRHIKDWLKQLGFKAETSAQIMRDYGAVDEAKKPSRKHRKMGENLSYDELSAIEDKWEQFKKDLLVSERQPSFDRMAWEFIDEVCRDTYITDDEKEEIFSFISSIESPIEEGKKLSRKHRKMSEDLSYGELVAISDEWEKFKKKAGRSDADTAWEFIETECKGVYDTDDEKDEIFAYISSIEEGKKPSRKPCKEGKKPPRRKGKAKLTEDKTTDPHSLAKDIKDAVEWLKKEQMGCVTLKLDDRLAVCVGWSGGYDPEDTSVIHGDDGDETYVIVAGIKVWTSDDMRTDYDYINYPYFESGEILDTMVSIEPNENYDALADYFVDEYNRFSLYNISEDGEILDEEVEEGKKPCKEAKNEDFKDVSVTTDKEHMEMTSDENGKVTITTEPVKEEGREETIEPVSDETKVEIEGEDEYEGEIGDEIDVELDDFDEESFDELGEAYLKKAYNNVSSYKTTCAKADNGKLVIEGIIKFNSGKEKKTSFVLESKDITKSGKSRFVGENMEICKGRKAFTVSGSVEGGKLISESMTYDYRTRDAKTGKPKRIYGTVSTKK